MPFTPDPQQSGFVPDSPESKVTGIPGMLLGASQGASDTLRTFGLGGIPDLMVAMPQGQNLQKTTGINPYINSQDVQNRMVNTPVGQIPNLPTAGRDLAGAASWLLPFGKGNLIQRLAMGGTGGLLQEASQSGANPGSLATSAGVGAGINAVLPGVGNALSQAAGRMAFGKGGEQFGNIVKETGTPMVGNASTLPKTIYDATAPIRDRFQNFISDPTKFIPREKIFGTQGASGAQDIPGMIGELLNTPKGGGFITAPQVQAYARTLQQGFNDIYTKYLTDHQDILFPSYIRDKMTPDQISTAILNIVQRPTQKVPTPVYQQFLEKLGADIQPTGWLAKAMGKNEDPTSKFATTLYSSLRDEIARSTQNPDLYDKLQGMKQAAVRMKNNLGAQSAGVGKGNLIRMLTSRGIPVEIAAGLLGGGGLPSIAGLGAAGYGIMSNPAMMSRAISAGMTKGENIMNAISKLGVGAAGYGTRAMQGQH